MIIHHVPAWFLFLLLGVLTRAIHNTLFCHIRSNEVLMLFSFAVGD